MKITIRFNGKWRPTFPTFSFRGLKMALEREKKVGKMWDKLWEIFPKKLVESARQNMKNGFFFREIIGYPHNVGRGYKFHYWGGVYYPLGGTIFGIMTPFVE